MTVGAESFTKASSYDHATGFRVTENIYGIQTTYAPDAHGNVGTVTKANGKATAVGYQWGVVKNLVTPEFTVTRTLNEDGTVQSETRGRATTQFGYDDIGRLTYQRLGTLAEINTIYDDAHATVTVTRGPSRIVTQLDAFGRPMATGNKVGVATETYRDAF